MVMDTAMAEFVVVVVVTKLADRSAVGHDGFVCNDSRHKYTQWFHVVHTIRASVCVSGRCSHHRGHPANQPSPTDT